MARIRSIKPSFWSDGRVAKLSDHCALFFIGLWNFCDDEGKCRNCPTELAYRMPRFRAQDIVKWLSTLREAGLVQTSTNREWIVVTGWNNQKINNPVPAKIKLNDIEWDNAVSLREDYGKTTVTLPLDRIGEDRMGVYVPPKQNTHILGELIEEWGKTLKHYKINKDPKVDDHSLNRLLKFHGSEKVRFALIGMRLEPRSENFDPADHVSLHRLSKVGMIEKFENLGRRQIAQQVNRRKESTIDGIIRAGEKAKS